MVATSERLPNPTLDVSSTPVPTIANGDQQPRFGKLWLFTRGMVRSKSSLDDAENKNKKNTTKKCTKMRRWAKLLESEETTSINVTANGDSRGVSFGSIEIRDHGRVLVDHPRCVDGLGLGLDWKHSKNITVYQIDIYERIRKSQGKIDDHPVQKVCTYDKKILLMKVGGYKEKELWEVFKQTYNGNITPAA
jgi:hypothetical protein